ncbi:hypothetical protein BDV33DRAFT_178365 [Aspergillus novoparasiticus]|uniref:Uncharacterized protein n=1 Tax=Aspergillus novoparasiticus TaxID=986946 RepID=A0A5N6EK87_9EURO|nr:hypothetical protein BDV33DRAFT_178365 [Aspergillus novoparasiticus]
MYVILGKGVRTTPICGLLGYQKSNVGTFLAYLWSWNRSGIPGPFFLSSFNIFFLLLSSIENGRL